MTVKELKAKLEEYEEDKVVVLETVSDLHEEVGFIQPQNGKFRSVNGAILQDNIILLSAN